MHDQREIAALVALAEQSRTLSSANPATYLGWSGKPYTPLKLSRRSRLRYRWTMATERFRRSLARRIYDFEDGW